MGASQSNSSSSSGFTAGSKPIVINDISDVPVVPRVEVLSSHSAPAPLTGGAVPLAYRPYHKMEEIWNSMSAAKRQRIYDNAMDARRR